MPDDEFPKQIDLEPSEFRPSDEPEPFWGWGAPDWNILFLQIAVGTAVVVGVKYLATGSLPYWLQHLQQ